MQTLFTKTGSDGNCTVFQDHKGMMLAVDCGIPVKEVNRGIDYKLSSVKHCLITHAHGDHTKYVNDFIQRGIHVYMSQDTKNALNICDGYYIHAVKDREQFQIGDSFIVLPFNVPHCNSDGSPCANYGFLIYSTADHEKIFFATDCQFIPQKFRRLDRIFIECNYRADEINEFSDMEDMNMYVEKRRLMSHMSEKACIEFLKKQDLSQTKEIRLLHLSSSQYYLKDTIKQEVEESIGKAVKI